MGNDAPRIYSEAKKQYEAPRLAVQDHMSRVTQKSGPNLDHPGVHQRWKQEHDMTPASEPGGLFGDDSAGSAGGGSGNLFDEPFD
jgi:hypothetical protein